MMIIIIFVWCRICRRVLPWRSWTVVFLYKKTRKWGSWREAKATYDCRILESYWFSWLCLLFQQSMHRREKNHGFLHRQGPTWTKNWMENERIQNNRRWSVLFNWCKSNGTPKHGVLVSLCSTRVQINAIIGKKKTTKFNDQVIKMVWGGKS